MWWNLTLCTCPEFNKLFPCFVAFVDGCIYVSTSSSITSGKLRLLSSHPSWRLPGKGRVIPHSMVSFSLRLVETSSSSSRVVLATSKFNFHAKYAFSASSYFLPDKTTPLFFKNVFNWSTFHLENSSIDISSVKLPSSDAILKIFAPRETMWLISFPIILYARVKMADIVNKGYCLVLVNGLSPIRIAVLKITSINRHECYQMFFASGSHTSVLSLVLGQWSH